MISFNSFNGLNLSPPPPIFSLHLVCAYHLELRKYLANATMHYLVESSAPKITFVQVSFLDNSALLVFVNAKSYFYTFTMWQYISWNSKTLAMLFVLCKILLKFVGFHDLGCYFSLFIFPSQFSTAKGNFDTLN